MSSTNRVPAKVENRVCISGYDSSTATELVEDSFRAFTFRDKKPRKYGVAITRVGNSLPYAAEVSRVHLFNFILGQNFIF